MVVVADSVCSQCRNSIPGSIGRCVAGSSAAYQNQAFHFLPGPVLNTFYINIVFPAYHDTFCGLVHVFCTVYNTYVYMYRSSNG